MAENTNIAWCDHTLNFWHGCTKVGPGCDNCYAEAFSKRVGRDIWGPGKERMLVQSAPKLLESIVKGAETFDQKHGRRQRVFVQSMSDTFDNEVPDEWRERAFERIEQASGIDFLMLTKRLPNVERMTQTKWRAIWPQHVMLIISVGTQEEVDREGSRLVRLKRLFNIPRVGFSSEPLLENLVVPPDILNQLSWVIVGGESGAGFRPMQLEWAEDIMRQCRDAGVPFFFKQASAFKPGQRGAASDELWGKKEFPV